MAASYLQNDNVLALPSQPIQWLTPVACGTGLLWAFFVPTIVLAHEVRPAYWNFSKPKPESSACCRNHPRGSEMRLALSPEFSGTHEHLTPLLKWIQPYEEKTGGGVLAIAHNGNLSNGRMLSPLRKVSL